MTADAPSRLARAARSLRWRLLAATVAGLALAMALAGWVLGGLFRDHVQRQFEAALTQQLDQLTAFMTALFPSLVTSSVNALNAVGADDAMAFVKIGASLANSASPPTPGYQNLGTSGPGQSQGYPGGALPFYLPAKGTTTVTTA